MDDPAHVARLVLPQQIGSSLLRFVAKQPAAECLDRINQPLPLRWRKFFNHCGHFAIRALIKRRKGSLPLDGQGKEPLPFVRF